MFNIEDIFSRKLRHRASQLRLFEINRSRINSVVGLHRWTTKNCKKRMFRRYWVKRALESAKWGL